MIVTTCSRAAGWRNGGNMHNPSRRVSVGIAIAACVVLAVTAWAAAATLNVPPAIKKAASQDAAPIRSWNGFQKAAMKVPAGKKHIVAIEASGQGRTTVDTTQGVVEAGKYLGWKVDALDGKGNPQVWNQEIQNAVNQHADAIVLSAIPPQLVGDALAKAAAAHIPVITILNPKPPANAHIFGWVAADHATDGKIMADWIWNNSGGNAHVVLVQTTEFPELVIRDKAFLAEMKKCTTCKVDEVVQFDFPQMPTQIPQKTITALQQHPDVNYVVTSFDTSATFAVLGIQQAGATGKVKVVSAEGDPDAMTRIRSNQQAADVAHPAEWSGWEAVNQIIRSMDKLGPTPHVSLPIRVMTRTNVPATSKTKFGWNGDYKYQAKYKSLWKK